MYANTQWGILLLMTDEVISSLLREIPGVYRTMRVDRLMKECLAYGLRRFQWRVSVYM